jgi:prevent-host-death family protein
MTRKKTASTKRSSQPLRSRWRLQDAKARFSELVRLAHKKGPQHVTLHGRDAVVVVAADEFRQLQGERFGQLLVDALQASPYRGIDLETRRSAMPVRDITFDHRRNSCSFWFNRCDTRHR